MNKSNITTAFFLIVITLNWPLSLVAQFNTTNSNANACICSGSCFFGLEATTFSYTLFDADNEVMQSGTSQNFISIGNMCPDVYTLSIETVDTNYIYWFNIATEESPLAEANQIEVCSTDGLMNLNAVLGITLPGGIWTNPSGEVINGQAIEASNLEMGWYKYTITDNADCSEASGLYIDFLQNASAGLSTTYLICDTYDPFSMLDFLVGQPDTGGVWTNEDGNISDGIFYPQQSNPGTFFYTYTIDTVPGCDPVMATLVIISNHQLSAGNDYAVTLCSNLESFDMFELVPGYPDAGGSWYNDSNEEIDPHEIQSGTFRYFVDSQIPCMSDYSFLTITVFEPHDSIQTENACTEYTWSVTNQTYDEPGDYLSNYIDVNGCVANLQLSLVFQESVTNLNVENCGPYFWDITQVQYSESGEYNKIFTNQFGCDSVFNLQLSIHEPYEFMDTVTACNAFLWGVNNIEYFTSGNFTATFESVYGCDSLFQLILEIIVLDASVVQSGDSLICLSEGNSFQWIDCTEDSLEIAGATAYNFLPSEEGNYGVLVTNNGCLALSDCINFIIDDADAHERVGLMYYPNPVVDEINVQHVIDLPAPYEVTDNVGHIIQTGILYSEKSTIELSNIPSGIYFLTLNGEVHRIIMN